MPVTEPPLKAASSAGGMPPRAASATRALDRTETFIPMKPAAPDRTPPMTKPMPVVTLLVTSVIAIASGMATTVMIEYWRRR